MTGTQEGVDEPGLHEQHRTTMLGLSRVLSRPLVEQPMRTQLASLMAEVEGVYDLSEPPDLYGSGVVEHLEERMADFLGKPAAAFFPTGTMAQQVALRCWSERTGSTKVGVHALSHPEVFEAGAFEKVSGLTTVRVAGGSSLVSAQAIEAAPAGIGAFMFELPLRDAGFKLPTWEELVAATQAARERGAIVHFDGARLFESQSHFGHSCAEIAALADTVFVSCYKSLSGLSGAILAGPEDVIAESRVWRHRYGGRVYQQYPAALSVLVGMERQLPLLAGYVERAKVVAAEMREGLTRGGLEWFSIQPEAPHIQEFQVWIPRPADDLTRAAMVVAQETGETVFQLPWWEPGMPPGLSVTEVSVDGASQEWSPGSIRDAARAFAEAVRTSD